MQLKQVAAARTRRARDSAGAANASPGDSGGLASLLHGTQWCQAETGRRLPPELTR
jgi:hypothetical protein